MSRDVYKKTSFSVPEQFPSLYRSEGPQFIEFVKTFYEWMEEEGPTYKSRRLLDYRDVDTTEDEYLSHFVIKYMNGLPIERLGDKRFIQKHVLDLYRSKGSIEGLKLLFRLLYGEEADVYVPSRDILKPSDGTWIEPKYLEVTYSPDFDLYDQAFITGSVSGATAIVESAITRIVRGRTVYILYLSNIEGDFEVEDFVTSALVSDSKVLGSVASVEVVTGLSDRRLGEAYEARALSGSGSESRVKVASLSSTNQSTVTFALNYGGFGYQMSTPLVVAAQPILTQDGDFLLTTEEGEQLDGGVGSGASLEIGSLINTSTVFIDNAYLYVYESDLLNAATFLYKKPILTEDRDNLNTQDGFALTIEYSGATINENVTISDWMDLYSVQIGTIASIRVLNDGSGYEQAPEVIAFDDTIYEALIPDGIGGYWGDDAIIDSFIARGTDYTKSFRVVDSGFGYSDRERITYALDEDQFLVTETNEEITTEAGDILFYGDTDEIEVVLDVNLSGLGKSQGYWKDTSGMLNADKYVQDSYYYQEYSYDVLSSKSLNSYEDILRKTSHPAGVELFGTAVVSGVADGDLEVLDEDWDTTFPSSAASMIGLYSPADGGLAFNVANNELFIADGVTPTNGYLGPLINDDGTMNKFTFTRTTLATLVNSSGLIQYAPHNLMTQSQTLDSATWNKSFTTCSANATTAPDGTSTADKLIETSGSAVHRAFNSISSTGVTSTWAIYAKASERPWMSMRGISSTLVANFNLALGTLGTSVNCTSRITAVGDGWYRCEMTGLAAASLDYMDIGLGSTDSGVGAAPAYVGDGTSGLFLWGASFNCGSTALPYVATTTAAFQGPRIDYSKGFSTTLITPGATNLIVRSEDFTIAPWVGDNGAAFTPVVTANQGIAPNGAMTADRIVLNKTGGTFSRLAASTVSSAGQAYVFSIYMKTFSGGTSNVGIRVDGTGLNCVVTGTWQRFQLSLVAAAGSFQNQIILFDSIPGNDETADILVWGAQNELGTVATDYIPSNAGTTTTRVPTYSYTSGYPALLMEGAHSYLHSYSQPTVAQLTVLGAPTNTTLSANWPGNWIFVGDNSQRRLGVQSMTSTSGLEYWITFYIQMTDGLPPVQSGAHGLSGWDFYPYITGGVAPLNPDTGTAGMKVEGPFPDNVYKISCYGVATTTGATSCGFDKVTTNSARTFKIGYVSFGQGRAPQSYVEATGTPVTRSTDACSIPNTLFNMSNTSGTLFADAVTYDVPANEVIVRMAAVLTDGASYTNAVRLERLTGVDREIKTVGGTSSIASVGAWPVSTRKNIALAYANANNAVSANGSVATSLSGGNMSGLTYLGIGGNDTGGNNWGGGILRVAYFGTRLTNTQLQALTT